MRDRVVEHPNRYKLQKVEGTDYIYDLIPAPGDIQEAGTYVNTANFLKDETAALYGLDNTAVPDDVFAAIKPLIDNNSAKINEQVKIGYGNYSGTGTYGSSNPCSLTFNFLPKIVIIVLDKAWSYLGTGTVFIYGQNASSGIGGMSSTGSSLQISLTWADHGVSWFSTSSADKQLNVNGITYHYVAFG